MTLTDNDCIDICNDIILSNKSPNKYDTFCHCKHTLEHMGWEDEKYFSALQYIAKELGLEK